MAGMVNNDGGLLCPAETEEPRLAGNILGLRTLERGACRQLRGLLVVSLALTQGYPRDTPCSRQIEGAPPLPTKGVSKPKKKIT